MFDDFIDEEFDRTVIDEHDDWEEETAYQEQPTHRPVGATFGNATTNEATAVILDNSIGLFDFVKTEGILCQVNELKADSDITLEDARRIAMGLENKRPNDIIAKLYPLDRINQPIMPGSKVDNATSKDINDFIMRDKKINEPVNLGRLLRREDVQITLDSDFVNQHVAIIGMIGRGKTVAAKTVLKQARERTIVIDPHGEYGGDVINVSEIDKELTLDFWKLISHVKDRECRDILNQISNLLMRKGEKLNKTNILNKCDESWVYRSTEYIDEIKEAILIENAIQYITCRLDIPFDNHLIINLNGINKELSQNIVKVIAEEILTLGKAGTGTDLFIDEAHRYVPQTTACTSKPPIIDLILEGRKFGCGVVLISQRPAKIDKDALSQCNTKLCLKLTNENDIKQMRNSTEFSTKQMFDEVQKLRIGEALLVSSEIERPIFIKVKA